MNAYQSLFALVGPSGDAVDVGRAQRLWLSVVAFLSALACAAVWGLAAGTGHGRLGLANLVTVPVLLTVSTLAAVPVVLFVWKLTSSRGRATDLLLAHASALLMGAMVLLLVSPLVALYQHTSTVIGPLVGAGSALVAFALGIFIFVRALRRLVDPEQGLTAALVPTVLLIVVQATSLMQVASLTDPVFPTRSAWGRGVDQMAAPAEVP